MYNISLYPLACKQCWMFNTLITCIPIIFKFHAFGKLQFHSIHVGLRVNKVFPLLQIEYYIDK